MIDGEIVSMRLTPKNLKALIKASELHRSQFRKADGFPYVTHLYSVAFILSRYTEDEDIIAAGLLHDVLEDIPSDRYCAEDMKREFGERVYEIVKGASEHKDPKDQKEDKRTTWKKRKERYLANLEQDSIETLMVSCADKIHNLISLNEAYKKQGDEVWEKFNSDKKRARWFNEKLISIMRKRLNNEMVDELEKAFMDAQEVFE